MYITDLFEGQIGKTYVGAAMSKIVSYLERHTGEKFIFLGTEKFDNSKGAGWGDRYLFDGSLKCVRFNWVGKSSAEIESVDFWLGNQRDPNYNISFKDVSLVKAVPALATVLKKPKIGTIKVAELVTENKVSESEYRELLRSHDWNYDYADGDEYNAGYNERKKLERLAKELDLNFKIWNSIAPSEHKRSVQKRRPEDAYDDYGLDESLMEAKKGEFTPEAAIADMILKLEAGRSFNRSEFVMNYHPENAHAYDEFVEENKDRLTIQGRRISLEKGQKLSGPAKTARPAKPAQKDSKGAAELVVQKGGSGEEYDVDVELESSGRVTFSESIQDLEALTQLLIDGGTNAMFVAGKGGTGKTQHVEKVLEKENGLKQGSGYYRIAGTITPVMLYTFMYKYRDQILLFDDCDNVFDSQESRNLIKAATDLKKNRTITWGKKSAGMYDPDQEPKVKKGKAPEEDDEFDFDSEEEETGLAMAGRAKKPAKKGRKADAAETDEEENLDDKIPRRFDFVGQIIFISNLPLNKLDPDGALRTRGFLIAIDPTPAEMISRMEEILHDVSLPDGLTLSKDEREQVMRTIKAGKAKDNLSLRTLVRSLQMSAAAKKSKRPISNLSRLMSLYA